MTATRLILFNLNIHPLTWTERYAHFCTYQELYAPDELKDIPLPDKYVPFEQLDGIYDIGDWTLEGLEVEPDHSAMFLYLFRKVVPMPIKAFIHTDYEYADYVMGYLPLFTIKPLRDFIEKLCISEVLGKRERIATYAALMEYGCVLDEEQMLRPFGLEWSASYANDLDFLYDRNIELFTLESARRARFDRKNGISTLLVLESFDNLNNIIL